MIELSLSPGAGVEIRSLGDLDRYLGDVAAAGFESISLNADQVGPDPAAAARLLGSHGLKCPDVLALRVSRHEEPTIETARELAAIAGEVGARYVLALVWAKVTDEVIDRFARCGDIVAASGARLALEMPPIGELNSITAALSVVEAAGRNRAALMIDTFHFSRGRSTWEELESFPLDALGYVQFDDALPPIGDDVMFDTTERRTFPGEGEFELDRFVDVLTGRGWSGLVSIEVLSAELRKLDVHEFTAKAYTTTASYWGL